MHGRRFAALAAFALVFALAACGGGDDEEVTASPAHKVAKTAACLRTAGADGVREIPADEFQQGIAREGAIEASYRRVNFAIVFEPNADVAIETATQYAAQAGGSWAPPALLRELLKRAENAVIAYEKKPPPATARAVERCLGGNARLDAAVEREFGR